MNGEILEEVDTFKYLGVTITKYGTSKAEIRIRLATSICFDEIKNYMNKYKNWQQNKLSVCIKH